MLLKITYLFKKYLLKFLMKIYKEIGPFFYIQKRYMHFNEVKSLIKKHDVNAITNVTKGFLFLQVIYNYNILVFSSKRTINL